MTPVPVPLLLVDDDTTFAQVLAAELERLGYAVTKAATGADAAVQAVSLEPAVVLLDLRLPDMDGLEVLQQLRRQVPGAEVIMLTGHGTIDTAIEAIRLGAFDYVAKPCPLDEIEIRIKRALERQALRARTTILERGLMLPDQGFSLVGQSPCFAELMHLIERVGRTDSSVLITGETGAGKEVVAKLLHARGARARGPFVVVECAALQENLLQSELFGHERGAFTGADRSKPGLFEVAHGGTILLDEIGEVSQATQVNLLRVLDTGTLRHVGGTKAIQVDVRVLAATNRDLAAMVRQNLFREDLYYRLSTITIEVPPLRRRRADIGPLAQHFVSLMNARFGANRKLSGEAMDLLLRHDWPGNVRELLHTIEAAMVVCEGPEILPAHLPERCRGGLPLAAAAGTPEVLATLEEMERTHIERVIRQTAGHRGNAARILGISERNLYRKLRQYGLLD